MAAAGKKVEGGMRLGFLFGPFRLGLDGLKFRFFGNRAQEPKIHVNFGSSYLGTEQKPNFFGSGSQ